MTVCYRESYPCPWSSGHFRDEAEGLEILLWDLKCWEILKLTHSFYMGLRVSTWGKTISGSIPNCSMAIYLIISSTNKYHLAVVDRRMGEM